MTPQAAEQTRQLTRSTFVTVLVWVLIVCSGFETFISLMQAVMLTFFFPDQFWSNTQSPHGIETLPPLMQFLFSKAQYFFLAFWLLSVVTLVSSAGLLRRKNWARLSVVGIFALAIVWMLGGIWLQSVTLATNQGGVSCGLTTRSTGPLAGGADALSARGGLA